MGMFFGIIGMLGFIVSLIILIVVAIKKKPKKKVGIVLGAFFILFVIGIATTPSSSDTIKTAENSNVSSDTQIKETVPENEVTGETEATGEAEKTENEEKEPVIQEKQVKESTPQATQDTETLGQKNARAAAEDYLNYSSFSYSGLIGQLEYEGYSTEEATYAADKCGADWNEQAAKTAKDYLDYSSFSRSGLIEQLEYEGFTAEQAEYAAQAVGY